MRKFITNPYFKKGLPGDNGTDPVSTDVEAVKKLLSLCPKAAETRVSAALGHKLKSFFTASTSVLTGSVPLSPGSPFLKYGFVINFLIKQKPYQI
mgnify:CR=1 FL=1